MAQPTINQADGFSAGALHRPMPPDVRSAMAAFYDQVDTDVAARRPVCQVSGRCCRFEEYGHRLYVTTLELQYFADVQLPAAPSPAFVPNAAPGLALPLYQPDGQFRPGCPFQVKGLCTARQARPLGCRIYFCDASSQDWQNEVYERYHRRLIELHTSRGTPYHYREWRQALALL